MYVVYKTLYIHLHTVLYTVTKDNVGLLPPLQGGGGGRDAHKQKTTLCYNLQAA